MFIQQQQKHNTMFIQQQQKHKQNIHSTTKTQTGDWNILELTPSAELEPCEVQEATIQPEFWASLAYHRAKNAKLIIIRWYDDFCMMMMMMMMIQLVWRMWIWEVGSVGQIANFHFWGGAEKNLKSGNYIPISNFLFYLSSVLFHQRQNKALSLFSLEFCSTTAKFYWHL